jgi:hypothetical protein
MKKLGVAALLLVFMLSGCIPSAPQAAATPAPFSEDELQATAALLSRQTLEAMPTGTSLPTETPVVVTPTDTPTPEPPTEIPTETPNPVLLTLTATLGAETSGGLGSLPVTQTNSTPSTPAGEPKPISYGTLPPSIPYGEVTIRNKSEVDAYISLRCVLADGNVTILEYPVKTIAGGRAPAGKYTYVAWVGGKQLSGSFSLSNGDVITINLFENRVTIAR